MTTVQNSKYDLEERTVRFSESVINLCKQIHKIFICKKEARETQYWLRNLAVAVDNEDIKKQCRTLWQEARELFMKFKFDLKFKT